MKWKKIVSTLLLIIAMPFLIILVECPYILWSGASQLFTSCMSKKEEAKEQPVSGFYKAYESTPEEPDEEGLDEEDEGDEEQVWICTGKYSHSYHYYVDCEGLLSCKADIDVVSVEEAEGMGRTPCSYCRERNATELDY